MTHGTDRVFWAFRKDALEGDQVDTARNWLDEIDKAVADAISKSDEEVKGGDLKRILTLRVDRTIGWDMDERWESMMELAGNVLPGEPRG